MKVLITGGTGALGKALGLDLARAGHELFVVSRKSDASLPYPAQVIVGDLTQGPCLGLKEKFKSVDLVVHLMGETVSQRWTEPVKARIFDSRVLATKNLRESLQGVSVGRWVSASAVGIYPSDTSDNLYTEGSAAGDHFLANVVKAWESAHDGLENSVSEVHHLRFGAILDSQSGALVKLLFPFQFGVGGRVGDGRVWMNWIHINDAVSLIRWVGLQRPSSPGSREIWNATAPGVVRNGEFSRALASVLGRSLLAPVPKLALKLLYGEMSSVILESQKVTSSKLVQAGFSFQFPIVDLALSDLLEGFQDRCFVSKSSLFIGSVKRADIFEWFCDVENLKRCTPPELHFENIEPFPKRIQLGDVVSHRVRLMGLPQVWKSKITKFVEGESFTDLQIQGPHGLWEHTHSFEALGHGVVIHDHIRYKMPLGIFGAFGFHFAQRQMEAAFRYRTQKFKEHLGREAGN